MRDRLQIYLLFFVTFETDPTLIGIQPFKIRKMKMFKTLAAWATFPLALLFIQPQSGFAQHAPKLADDEIASVAVVANQNDINFAGIAQAPCLLIKPYLSSDFVTA